MVTYQFSMAKQTCLISKFSVSQVHVTAMKDNLLADVQRSVVNDNLPFPSFTNCCLVTAYC